MEEKVLETIQQLCTSRAEHSPQTDNPPRGTKSRRKARVAHADGTTGGKKQRQRRRLQAPEREKRSWNSCCYHARMSSCHEWAKDSLKEQHFLHRPTAVLIMCDIPGDCNCLPRMGHTLSKWILIRALSLSWLRLSRCCLASHQLVAIAFWNRPFASLPSCTASRSLSCIDFSLLL